MSIRTKIGAGLVALLPMVSLAQIFDSSGYLGGGSGLFGTFATIVGILLPAMIGLVVIGFAYGLFIYVKGGAEDQAKGKSVMFWGALAVVILLSIYGIAGLVQDITGADSGVVAPPPTTLPSLPPSS